MGELHEMTADVSREPVGNNLENLLTVVKGYKGMAFVISNRSTVVDSLYRAIEKMPI
jgi:hypothetical protein